MSATLKHYTIADDFAEIIEQVDRDGGVIVEQFITDELRQRIINELKPHADGFEPGIEGGDIKQLFCGVQTKRFTGLAAKAPSFAEVIDHDLLHTWADHGFANDYWINTGQAMIIGPGSPSQILHRDCGNWPIMHNLGKDGPEATLSILLAVSDFTADNGATRVVPGSHLWDDYSVEADEEQVTQAVMPAGSALLYTGKTIHGAGANVSSDTWRFGIHLSFTLGQLTPEEASPFTVPWEIAREFPERVQHMLGYFSHRTFDPEWPILWTSDYRDVRESLQPPARGDYISPGQKTLGVNTLPESLASV
ncbi:MAG: phytanoyl-CoA dioxygenase family protein [Pseudomonadota bacterium]